MNPDSGKRPIFTVLTPSRGDRPKALAQCLHSVLDSARAAGLVREDGPCGFEHLVGFDGIKGERPLRHSALRYFDFPHDGDYGNAIRNGMLKAAKGSFLLFVDDDNAMTRDGFSIFARNLDVEFILARIDTGITFDIPYIPVIEPGREVVRHTNVDPLCLCLSRELVVGRCKGWGSEGGYRSDYVNILRYWRRASSHRIVEEVVGVYDAGIGLDGECLSPMQRKRLEQRQSRLRSG